MSVIATVVLPADGFVLDGVLAEHPDLRLRIERVVPTGDRLIPYLWVSRHAVGDVESVFRCSGDVESVAVVDAVEGEALVRIEWAGRFGGVLDVLAETRGTVLHAEGEAGSWTLRVQFDRHEDLTAFFRRCAEQGIPIDLAGVHSLGPPRDSTLDLGLTDTQYRTLVTALDRGYFDVPRRANLTDLAAEIGVSDTAVSQRLRRGVAAVLRATLPETDAASDAG